MVCHVFIPFWAFTIALHVTIFLVAASRNWNMMMTRSGRKILTCIAPSRVILDAFPKSVRVRNEVPFHVSMVIANGHEESPADERHLFIPEMEFW